MLAIAAALALQAGLAPGFVQQMESAPILMIHASVLGHDRLFGIDTGSSSLLIKPGVIQAIDDPGSGKSTIVPLDFLSGAPVQAQVATFPTPADGVIGLGYLKEKAIGVDAYNKAFSVWKEGNLSKDQVEYWFSHAPRDGAWYPFSAKPYQTIEMKTIDGDSHYFIDGSVDGKPITLGLDTDSATTAIEQNVIPADGFTPLYEGQFGGLKGNWPIQLGIADSFSLGTEELRAYPISQVPPGSLKPAQGIIGFDMLMNRRAIIDFPARKLYLGPLNDETLGSEALLPLGIRLAPFMGGKQWIGVIPGSPADKAGLQSGDELVEVDGKPVSASNLPITHSSLAVDYAKTGIPDSLKVLVKEKGGEPKTYEIKRA